MAARTRQPGAATVSTTRFRWTCPAYAGLAALAALLMASTGCTHSTPPAPPMPEVEVSQVITQDVPVFAEWIGTLDGMVHAHVHPQVSGYLMARHYREGSEVKKGDLMFEIDPRPFKAVLDQTLARMGKSELDVKRLTPLAAEKAVSQEELDNAVQALLGDKAAVEQAKVNLEFTKVTSPLDGLSGLANAMVGDLVGPNTEELTTVTTVDPIKANFSVSEQEYLTFMARFATESERSETNDAGRLDLVLVNDTVYPQKGQFYAADNQIDPRTGALRMAAVFPNPKDLLRPGQFARIRLTRIRHAALLVPQRAVSELQGNYQLLVVDAANRAHLRAVKVGPVSGAMWIIESGVQAGERVIVEGLQKARDGMTVNPRPYVPAAPPAPDAAAPR